MFGQSTTTAAHKSMLSFGSEELLASYRSMAQQYADNQGLGVDFVRIPPQTGQRPAFFMITRSATETDAIKFGIEGNFDTYALQQSPVDTALPEFVRDESLPSEVAYQATREYVRS